MMNISEREVIAHMISKIVVTKLKSMVTAVIHTRTTYAYLTQQYSGINISILKDIMHTAGSKNDVRSLCRETHTNLQILCIYMLLQNLKYGECMSSGKRFADYGRGNDK